MINNCAIKDIDICNTFFDIQSGIIEPFYHLFFEGEFYMPKVNKVITKPYAINIAIDRFKSEVTEYSKLSISIDTIKAKQAIDYMGEAIFPTVDDNISGWLVFFDPFIFRNWEHSCKYLFIVNEFYNLETDYTRPCSEGIIMEAI